MTKFESDYAEVVQDLPHYATLDANASEGLRKLCMLMWIKGALSAVHAANKGELVELAEEILAAVMTERGNASAPNLPEGETLQ